MNETTPSPSLAPQEDKIMTELGALQSYLVDAKKQLEMGKIVGMEGIEDRVTQLCKDVTQAPKDQQQAYLPGLTVLIDLMNGYEQDLRTRSAALTQMAQTQSPDPNLPPSLTSKSEEGHDKR